MALPTLTPEAPTLPWRERARACVNCALAESRCQVTLGRGAKDAAIVGALTIGPEATTVAVFSKAIGTARRATQTSFPCSSQSS